MTYLYTNNAVAQLASAITNVATTLQLVTGQGAKFPSPTVGQQFQLTLFDAATQSVVEICTCTSRSSDTLTVIRGQEGTVSSSYLIGDGVALRVTALEFSDFASQTQGANFSGTTTCVTATVGDSSTKIANTQFVAQNYVSSSNPALTGAPTTPNAPIGIASNQIANMSNVQNQSGVTSANLTLTGTPTTPTPTFSNLQQVANVSFVESVAYASLTLPVLQSQTFTTDGNQFLNQNCYKSEFINAPANYQFQLPNATGLTVGFAYDVYSVNNWYAIYQDGSGLGVIPAGLTRFWLQSNATANGTWSNTTPSSFAAAPSKSLNGGLTTAVVASGATILGVQQLDQTRTLLCYSISTGIYAVVLTTVLSASRPSVSVGTPVAILTGTSITASAKTYNVDQTSASIALIASNQVVLTWLDNSSGIYVPNAVAITISGTVPSPGTVQALHAGNATAPYSRPGVVATGSGQCMITYIDFAILTLWGRGCTVSGNALTLGVETTIQGGCPNGYFAVAATGTTGQAIVSSPVSTSAVSTLRTISTNGTAAITVNGGTSTVGTLGATGTAWTNFVPLTATTGVFCATAPSASPEAIPYTISAGVITLGTVFAGTTTGYGGYFLSPTSIIMQQNTLIYNVGISGNVATSNGSYTTTSSNGSPMAINGNSGATCGGGTNNFVTLNLPTSAAPTLAVSGTIADTYTANSVSHIIGNSGNTVTSIDISSGAINAKANLTNFPLV